MKTWYVMTPAGRAGPYVNCQAAHDVADPLGYSVFSIGEDSEEGDDADFELEEDCLGYEDHEGSYDSDYADE